MMFGKIKKYLMAALSLVAGNRPSEGGYTLTVPPASLYMRHTGKGRNKQPHRFSGVAAAKRAARKARRKAK